MTPTARPNATARRSRLIPSRIAAGAMLIGLAVALLLPSGLSAATFPDSVRMFMSLIESNDVRPILPQTDSLTPRDPADFWNAIINGHRRLNDTRRDVEKKKTAARNALDRLHRLPHYSRSRIIGTVDSLQAFIDSVSGALGFEKRYCEQIVVDHSWASAITALRDRGGFAVIVNSGLLERCGESSTPELCLTGALAHAYVHGILLHHLRHFYGEERKIKRIKLWMAISSIVMPSMTRSLPDAVFDYTHNYDYLSQDDRTRDYLDNIDSEAATFFFPFCDELEVEADIVAYRFMEWLGHGDAYIESLRATDNPAATDLYSITSLSEATRFRISLLEFMRDNPDLRAYRRERARAQKSVDPLYD